MRPNEPSRPKKSFARRLMAGLAVVSALFPSSGAAAAQDPAALFQQVFGSRERPEPSAFDAPVRYLVYELGPATIEISEPDGAVLIDADDLEPILTQSATESVVEDFKRLSAGRTRIDIAELSSIGVRLDYDPGDLALDLDIPDRLRKIFEISLAPLKLRRAGEEIGPAAFSAYVTARGRLDARSRLASNASRRFSSAVSLDGAASFAGRATIEARADYDQRSERGFALLDARLNIVDIDKRLKLTFGDLEYRSVGFQSFERLVGVSASRDFNLQPERSPQPRGRRVIIVDQRSIVEVYANGVLIDTFSLLPGRYRLSDLPLSLGGNDVTLKLTDAFGQERLVNYSVFFDQELLAAGESDFSYTLGAPAERAGAYQKIEDETVVFSGFHAIGVTDALTAGLTLQAGGGDLNAGATGVAATAAGNFQLAVEYSAATDPGEDDGVAATLQYEAFNLLNFRDDIYTDFQFQTTFQSERYKAFRSGGGDNDELLEFIARVDQQLPQDWSASLSGSRRVFRAGSNDRSVLSLNFRKLFETGLNLNFGGEWRSDEDGSSLAGSVSLTFFFQNGGHSLQIGAESENSVVQTAWSRRPRRLADSFAANVAASRSSSQHSAEESFRFTGQRFETELRHRLTDLSGDGDAIMHEGSAVFAGSLAVADGLIAVSRPVQDSFAIIRRHKRFRDTPVIVDASRNAYTARTDGFGPLVAPNLSSHVARQFRLEAPGQTIGQNLGDTRPWVRPGERSGVVITAGVDANVILRTNILSADGAPRALIAGSLRAVGDAGQKEIAFFTNRSGRAVIDGLKPGRYLLVLNIDGKPQTTIEIPEDAEGVYDAGDIAL